MTRLTLPEILKNASPDTLALNGFHRAPSGLVVASPKRQVQHRQPKPKSSEHDEQVKLFQIAQEHVQLANMFAIPNGGLRSKATAGRLKAEGVRSGVPDIFLPVASRGYHGCFLEMKVGYNKPTDNQEQWMEALTNAGYYCIVCWSAEEALNKLLWYTDYSTEQD